MVGKFIKDKDGNRKTHFGLLEDDDVRRWYENLKAGSNLTAGVYLRGLGFYCENVNTTPKKILEDAKEIKPLQDQFMDFVRDMERKGNKGAYIARYKKILHSWTKHNGVEFKAVAKITNENINVNTENETVPSQDELDSILRQAGMRGKTAIALMSFAGLRPVYICLDDGSDALRIGDIPELKIENGRVSFEKVPIRIRVRAVLNKGKKHAYSTFMGQEGLTYLREYLEYRMSEGEKLTNSSPIIQYDRDVKKKHEFVTTHYIEKEIRQAIIDAGFFEWGKKEDGTEKKTPTKRPYALRAYFATAMDISEQKGHVSHPWRQYWMGHVGDMESRYSTNKNHSDTIIEEMRSAYSRCLQYLETKRTGITEDERGSLEKTVTTAVLKKLGFSDKDIDEMVDMDDEEFQKAFREKRGMALNNGHRQKVIPQSEIRHYIEDLGWEYVKDLNTRESIVKLLD